MTDPTKKKGGATPMDSNPTVVQGTYPNDVDWLKIGENYAGRGKNANKLRATMDVLNNLPTNPKTGLFQEQADRIPGDIFHSGRQLDNAGDITHCMFVSAACAFMMISEFLPDVGIEIIAGNNQFYKNFVNSKGKRLDNNHVRGRGINFVVKGIDNEKVRNGTLSSDDQNIIDEIETILQRVAAGNRHFQYINEYDLETQDGDPRYSFLMSLSGKCCDEEKGGVYIEYGENEEPVNQGTHWWNDFVEDSIKLTTEGDDPTIPYRAGYDPTNWTGEFKGYVEGVRYKEASIGRALLNEIEIVDMHDVVSGFNMGEFAKENLAEEMFEDCGGGHEELGIRFPLPPLPNINFPKININVRDWCINIHLKLSQRKEDKEKEKEIKEKKPKKTRRKRNRGKTKRKKIRRNKPQYSTKFSVVCPRKR